MLKQKLQSLIIFELMDKIVFTLNNTGIHHEHTAITFLTFQHLLGKPQSGVHHFIESINAFTEEDFQRLNMRIQDKHTTRVPMTEKHLIIFYATVHYACVAHFNANERQLLKSLYTYEPEDINIIAQKILQFGSTVSEKLRRDFPKLNRFQKVAELISID